MLVVGYRQEKILERLFEDRLFRQQLSRIVFGMQYDNTVNKQITLLLIQKIKQIKEEMDTDLKLKTKLDNIQYRIN